MRQGDRPEHRPPSSQTPSIQFTSQIIGWLTSVAQKAHSHSKRITPQWSVSLSRDIATKMPLETNYTRDMFFGRTKHLLQEGGQPARWFDTQRLPPRKPGGWGARQSRRSSLSRRLCYLVGAFERIAAWVPEILEMQRMLCRDGNTA